MSYIQINEGRPNGLVILEIFGKFLKCASGGRWRRSVEQIL
jgi:hypothetical protein